MDDNKKQYSIIRVKKLNKKKVIDADRHNKRLINVPNADGSKSIEVIELLDLDSHHQPLLETINLRMNEFNVSAKRKDAVLAIEILLTATPAYFTLDSARAVSKENIDKLAFENWRKTAIEWLQQKFGRKLLQAQLHLDESTPHLHAFILPLVSDNSKLCAKELVTRTWLFTLHDDYSRAMKSLGLNRGKRHSQAKHQTLKAYGLTMDKVDAEKLALESLQMQKATLVARRNSRVEEIEQLESKKSCLDDYMRKAKVWVSSTSISVEKLKKDKHENQLAISRAQKEIKELGCERLQAKHDADIATQKLQRIQTRIGGLENEFDGHYVFLKEAEDFANKFNEEVAVIESLIPSLSYPPKIANRLTSMIVKMKARFEQFSDSADRKLVPASSTNNEREEVTNSRSLNRKFR